MTFWEYRKLIERTANRSDTQDKDLCEAAMGLAGETGEVVDYLKKVVFHGHALDSRKFEEELGDVFWYLAYLMNTLEIDHTNVMQRNIDKLKARYPSGFNPLDSINRTV